MLALAYFWYWLSHKEDGEMNGNSYKTYEGPSINMNLSTPFTHRAHERETSVEQCEKQNISLHFESADEEGESIMDEYHYSNTNSESNISGVRLMDETKMPALQVRQNSHPHSKFGSQDGNSVLAERLHTSTTTKVPSLHSGYKTNTAMPLGGKLSVSQPHRSKCLSEENEGGNTEQYFPPQEKGLRFCVTDKFTPASRDRVTLETGHLSSAGSTSRETTKLSVIEDRSSPVNEVSANCGDGAGHHSAVTATEAWSMTVKDCGDSDQHQPQSPGCTESGSSHRDEEIITGGPKFDPPVYIQRYALVKNIMKKHSIQSMVDFGSSECKIIRWLKEIDTLTNLCLVDIDGVTLSNNIFIVKPLNCEYLFRRPLPLSVNVFEGSAGDLDCRVAGCQAASMVEIIEHLEPEVLEQVTRCVFGRLRPSVVVVTTPNADFNVLFPGFTGYRHWDHKFEWTREEFHEWCEAVCSQHGYSVTYTGVGDPLPEMSHVGFCSQAAIFTEISGKPGEKTEEEVYKLVEKVVYPFDPRTPAERLTDEVDMAIHNCRYLGENTAKEEDRTIAVPIASIVNQVMTTQRNRNKWTSAQIWWHICSTCEVSADGNNVLVEQESDKCSSGADTVDEDDLNDSDGRAEPCYDVTVEEDWG